MSLGLLFVGFVSVLALLWSFYGTIRMCRKPRGTREMIDIQNRIRSGAWIFMLSEAKVMLVCMALVGTVLWFVFFWQLAVVFWLGSVLSMLAGFIGMNSATLSNSRTTHAASKSIRRGLNTAFLGGSVMGMAVVGLALGGLALIFLIFPDIFSSLSIEVKGSISFVRAVLIISAYSAGASLVALFSRVGGGIYTKAADMAADSVGKLFNHMPEDDPRNPATIADNVGDNVGDVAGLGADLLESFIGAAASAIIIGMYMHLGRDNGIGQLLMKFGQGAGSLNWIILLPLLYLAGGIVACFLGIAYIRLSKKQEVQNILMSGSLVSAISTTGFIALITWLSPFSWTPFYAAAIGIFSGVLIGMVSEYYTSSKYLPVRRLAKSFKSGAAVGINEGMALGLISTWWPCLIIGGATIVAYQIGGLLAIAYAAMGMLSFLGMTVSIDSYGPIADNASGIATMAKLEGVREKTDKLDAVGNTTAAIGKGFAIGSAAFASLGLIAAFIWSSASTSSQIVMPTLSVIGAEVGGFVLAGMIIGISVPAVFSAILIRSVSRTARIMIKEIKRQFQNPLIMEGKEQPDYKKCIEITAHGGVRQMILPSVLALGMPLAIGFLLGRNALAGFLLAALLASVLLALWCANAGGAMDNAKKFIEEGNHGGKGSSTHDIAIIADMVGDPLKDTVGPSLDVLVKLMCIISLLCASLFPAIPYFFK